MKSILQEMDYGYFTLLSVFIRCFFLVHFVKLYFAHLTY